MDFLNHLYWYFAGGYVVKNCGALARRVLPDPAVQIPAALQKLEKTVAELYNLERKLGQPIDPIAARVGIGSFWGAHERQKDGRNKEVAELLRYLNAYHLKVGRSGEKHDQFGTITSRINNILVYWYISGSMRKRLKRSMRKCKYSKWYLSISMT